MNRFSKIVSFTVVLLATLVVTGCIGYSIQKVHKTSLVEFLYPNKQGYVEPITIPHLALPLRVGVAFTPAPADSGAGFSELEKNKLAKQVARQFSGLDFVKSIEVIPSDYLRPQGGFTNLQQLQQLFKIDVIVLLSYDQVLFTDRGFASLTYWTIVGAYVIPAEKNSTQTLIDAAVFDITSRSLLFRAPGTSEVRSLSTLVANEGQALKDSVTGFADAGVQLSVNLKQELASFKIKVKEEPEQYKVSYREGYSGGGVNKSHFYVLACFLATLMFARPKQRK